MKLKDFVFNSLRVRGKKKKAVPSATPAVPDISTGCFGLDKNRNWFPSSNSRSRSQGSSFEGDDLRDANWHSNALYKGLVLGEDVKNNCTLMTLDYSSCTFSHSDVGSSSSFTGFDRTLDNSYAQETVSENFGSCSSMSPLSEAGSETSLIHQQYYNYHRHQERHNSHIGDHLHSKKMTTILQQHNHSVHNVQHLSFQKSQTSHKPETGFFRRSLASFKSMRKDSNKSKSVCSKPTGHSQMDCSTGFLPENTTANKVSGNKMSTKTKKRGSKLFSKSTENRDVAFSTENFENQWALESSIKDEPKSAKVTMDPFISTCMPYDRPYVRESSVESCPPRHYSFQEEFSLRDFDLTSFESASFSGYESDISRSRCRKARSRIKTNPWLPSPQLTHSVASRWKEFQVRDSPENMPLLEEDWGFPQADSLEYHEGGLQRFQAYPTSDSKGYQRKHSTRKSPNGIKMASNLNSHVSSPYSVTKRSLDQQYSCFTSSKTVSPRTPSLNDLNTNTPTIREASSFSPNTEFSMLTENLEQLATNISFEYEDAFDTTMESVSAGRETYPVFFQEICTDDENSQIPQQTLQSDSRVHATHSPDSESRIHMAHSPDSGVGGLSYSDGDTNQTPPTQREAREMLLECLMSSTLLDTSSRVRKEVPVDSCTSGRRQEPRTNSSCDTLKPQYCSTVFIHNISPLSSPQRKNAQIVTSKGKSKHEDNCFEEENSPPNMYEYLCGKKTCHQDTPMTTTSDAQGGHSLFIEKTYIFMDNNTRHTDNTQVDEEECLATKTHTQNEEFFASSKPVATEVSFHKEIVDVPHLVKLSSEYIPASDETTVSKNSRPTSLKTKSRMLNNMEKASDHKELVRSWMDEFDCPRNITASESVESPTENWQWDYQFAMYTSLDAGSPGGQVYQVVFDDIEDKKADVPNGGGRIVEIEELVVTLEDTDHKLRLQQKTHETMDSIEKSHSEKLENGSLAANFDMNDACVQTDFDDDFDTLDEVNDAEDLEEGLYDLSESSHLWLPTRNVLVDSQMCCTNQTRDSEIMYDKCAAVRPEERKEHGSPSRSELRNLVSKTYVCPDTHSYDAISGGLQAKSYEHTNVESNGRDENMKRLSSDSRALTVDKRSKSQTPQELTLHSGKAIPENTVNILLSGAEMQFRDNLDQICHGCEPQRNQERSLQNSQTIVELSGSDCSPSDNMYRKEIQCHRNWDTGRNQKEKSLIQSDNVQYSDRISDSTRQSNTLLNYAKSNRRILKDEKMAELSHVDANGNFLYNRSRLKRSCEPLQRFSTSKQDNFDDFIIAPLNANKAAFLTFDDDSPLCQSLVERPLWLVPDVHSLSRLRFERMKGISQDSPFVTESNASCVYSTSFPLFTSSSVTNCQDMLQYKKNYQTLLQGNENVIDLLAETQSRSSSSSATQYSLRILKDRLENGEHSLSASERSQAEFSELVSNSVYSFAKVPCYFQPQDLTQSSFLATSSYCAATRAKRQHFKSPFSFMESDIPPTANHSGCLAEKVISLCQEKDLIFQKIYEAKQEEVCRKEQRLQIQRRMQAQTREALLQPLIELRNKLEEQSRRLNEKCNVNGNSNSPFRFL